MILIAEDNPLMQKMLRSLIEDLDPEIIECANGAEAVRLFEKHHPDWVMMDIRMRPVDGLTATREIIVRNPSARIIIITEHDDEATRRHALAAGALEFIGKGDLRPLRKLIGSRGQFHNDE